MKNKFKSIFSKRIARIALNTGGCTVDNLGRAPISGYVIGGIANDRVLNTTDWETLSIAIAEYAKDNKCWLQSGFFLGVWIHEGKTYLDICSVSHTDKSSAIFLGETLKQDFIYHIDSDTLINCKV